MKSGFFQLFPAFLITQFLEFARIFYKSLALTLKKRAEEVLISSFF
jgi:hypothetical protein